MCLLGKASGDLRTRHWLLCSPPSLLSSLLGPMSAARVQLPLVHTEPGPSFHCPQEKVSPHNCHLPTAPLHDGAGNRTSLQSWDLVLRSGWLCLLVPRSHPEAKQGLGGLRGPIRVDIWTWAPVLLPLHAQSSGFHLPIYLTLRIDNCGISCPVPIPPEFISPCRHCDCLIY